MRVKERVPGIVAKRDRLLISKRLDSYLGLQTRANEMLYEENLKGRQDQVRWQGIQANFDFASAQIKQDLPVQRQLEEKMQSEQLRLAELVIHELGRLVASFVPAVSAVRRELDLPIDEAELRGPTRRRSLPWRAAVGICRETPEEKSYSGLISSLSAFFIACSFFAGRPPCIDDSYSSTTIGVCYHHETPGRCYANEQKSALVDGVIRVRSDSHDRLFRGLQGSKLQLLGLLSYVSI